MHMMSEENRLGTLEVRVAGHHDIAVEFGKIEERTTRFDDSLGDLEQSFAHPETEVERHLIVAAARRMESPRDRPDELVEAPLYAQVNVLVRQPEREALLFDLAKDGPESTSDRLRILPRDDSSLGEHGHVRERAQNIVARQPSIEGEGRIELIDEFVRRLLETTSP
jgi:hypothetical protein